MHDNEAMVRSILLAFGSYSTAARKIGAPSSTVYFWARNKNIPHWRRGDVLRAAGLRRIRFTDEQREYLQSKEKSPVPRERPATDGTTGRMSEPQQNYALAATSYSKEI